MDLTGMRISLAPYRSWRSNTSHSWSSSTAVIAASVAAGARPAAAPCAEVAAMALADFCSWLVKPRGTSGTGTKVSWESRKKYLWQRNSSRRCVVPHPWGLE
jgi:hypothetical protein